MQSALVVSTVVVDRSGSGSEKREESLAGSTFQVPAGIIAPVRGDMLVLLSAPNRLAKGRKRSRALPMPVGGDALVGATGPGAWHPWRRVGQTLRRATVLKRPMSAEATRRAPRAWTAPPACVDRVKGVGRRV
jgi:hypothetical protein